jgi:WD40 repeat protein
MIDSIMRKASGCFLWVRLVLSEMRTVHTADEVREVLEDVPSDMDSLYSRILESMSSLKRGKALTKAILAWVTCSVRPLKIEELHEALELDVGNNIVSVRRSIASTCGQLVYVDSSSRVQLIHQTARDFLLRADNMSEFAMERKEGHRRLAMVCLKYLRSSKMAGPKPRKLSATSKAGDNDRSPFLAYAGNALPNHIAMVSSEDDPFFFALAQFLASPNVLSWIEYISKSSDLNRLIETGKTIRQYLRRRASHVVPLGKDTKLLESWSIDLVRLLTKFGRNLAASPSAMYHLIPPFYPPESALNQQFGASNRSITVKGLTASAWDDCASVINYQRENPTAIACSPSIFAVGQKSGKIKIHHETSCQELRTLLSDEPIKLLQFGETGDYLAALTLKYICVWNTRWWEIARQFSIETPCMDVSFADNDQMLLAVSRDNCLLAWDLLTGDCRQLRTWVDELDEEYTGDRPAAATISNDSTMVAVVYRGQDIIVWDVEYESVHDIYGQVSGSLGPRAKKRSARAFVRTLLFSRASESGVLAAGYMDGELVVFNTIDRKIQARTSANAHSLVSSPNGLMMACGNSAGMILLFEFETLKLFYRIVSEEYSIKALVFTADNHRLIDIRGPYCRVWEPFALFRDTLEEDDNSDTLSISTMPQEYTVEDTQQVIHISALFCAEKRSSSCVAKSTAQSANTMWKPVPRIKS